MTYFTQIQNLQYHTISAIYESNGDLRLVDGTFDLIIDEDQGNYNVTYSIFTSDLDVEKAGSHYDDGSPESTAFVSNYSIANQYIEDTYRDTIFASSSVGNHVMLFGDVANVKFTEIDESTSDAGVIGIGQVTNSYPSFDGNDNLAVSRGYEDTSSADAIARGGDIWINTDAQVGGANFWVSGFGVGDAQFKTLLEEVTHSLGFDIYQKDNRTNSAQDFHPVNNPLISSMQPYDSQKYTLTSYVLADGMDGTGSSDLSAYTLQLFDVAALQSIYGRNYDKLASDTTHSLTSMKLHQKASDTVLYNIWDGDGVDTIDAQSFAGQAKIDLRQGAFSTLGEDMNGNSFEFQEIPVGSGAIVFNNDFENVSISSFTVIENAIGTNDASGDFIIGNAWDNKLEGLAGSDFIFGDGVVYGQFMTPSDTSDDDAGFIDQDAQRLWSADNIKYADDLSGRDTLDGGAGNDFLYGGAGNDTLIGGAGTDLLDGGEDGFDIADYTAHSEAITVTRDGAGTYDWIVTGGAKHGTDNLTEIEIIKASDATTDTINLGSDTSKITNIGSDGENLLIGIDPDGSGAATTQGTLFRGFEKITFSGNDDTIEINGTHAIEYDGNGGTNSVAFREPDTLGFQAPSLGAGEGLVVSASTVTNTVDNSTFTDFSSFENFGYAQISEIRGFTYKGEFRVNEGDSLDYSSVTSTSGIDFDITAGTITLKSGGASDSFDGILTFVGSGSGDTFDLTGAADYAEIHSGSGNDTISGDVGDEATFIFTGGDDTLYGGFGAEIFLPESIRATDISFSVVNNDDLRINVSSLGTITIEDYFDNSGGPKNTSYLNYKTDSGDPLSLYLHPVSAIYGSPTSPASAPTDPEGGYFETFLGSLRDGNDIRTFLDQENNVLDLSALSFEAQGIISGLGGDDTITGTSYTDVIYGGAGDDELNGGSGNATDYLMGNDGDDELNGGEGNDILGGGAGMDIIDGGSGEEDWAYYGLNTSRVYVDLTLGQADDAYDGSTQTFDDTLSNIEGVVGSDYDDTILGDVGDNQFFGNGGDDTLSGKGGVDKFYIGLGLDTITDFDTTSGSRISIENLEVENFADLTITHTNTTLDGQAKTLAEIYTPSGEQIGKIYLNEGQALTSTDFEYNALANFNSAPFGPSGSNTLPPGNYEIVDNEIVFRNQFTIMNARRDITWNPDQYPDPADQGWRYNYSALNPYYLGEDHSIIIDNNHMPMRFSAGGRGLLKPDEAMSFASIRGGSHDSSTNGNRYHGEYAVDAADWALTPNQNLIINEPTVAGHETLTIKNLTVAEIVFTVSGGSLIISKLNGGAGHVTITGSYIPGYGTDVVKRVEKIILDDGEIELADNLPQLDDGDNSNAGLNGSVTDDVINGNGGNDTINAGSGDDEIDGGADDDVINGQNGADIIAGGEGNDTLNGGRGDDVYIFAASADGAPDTDTASENLNEGTDVLRLGAGITTSDIRTWMDFSYDYSVELVATGDVIKFDGQPTGGFSTTGGDITSRLETVEFADGTIWDLTQGLYLNDNDVGKQVNGSALSDTIDGNGGIDQLYGFEGDDSLEGGEGNDSLYGGVGNDTYIFVAGTDGTADTDTVGENLNEGTDKLLLGAGITTSDINTWMDNSYSYHVEITATGDVMKFTSQPTGGYSVTGGDITSRLETVEFADGTIWDLTQGLFLNDNDAGKQIWGSALSDTIDGNGGIDQLYGFEGDDSLEGGEGNDSLYGGVGNDIALFSGAYADYTITDFTSYIRVVDDNTVDGDEGTDNLYDIENISFSDGVWASGAFVPNAITGTASAETLNGSISANVISGLAGNDVLNGLAGDDTLDGGAGDDTLDGGDGSDTASYANDAAGVDVHLANGTATDGNGDSDTLISIENADGSAFDDTLFGSAAANVINGNSGRDDIQGDAGNDQLDGGADEDLLLGGDGDDILRGGDGDEKSIWSGGVLVHLAGIQGGWGNDTLYGDAGNDVIYGEQGDDILYGGDGDDVLYGDDQFEDPNYVGGGKDIIYGGAGNDVIATGRDTDIAYGGDDNDVLYGGSEDDTLFGDAGNDILHGYQDDDTLEGGDGADTIYGDDQFNTVGWADAGDDTIRGNGGADTLLGGEGNDDISGGTENDTIYGHSGNDTINGDEGNDIIYGDFLGLATVHDGNDIINGGAGVDTINAGGGNDTVNGGDDADTVYGRDGDDTINGDGGTDILYGEAGADTIRGGAGNDSLFGGNDNDVLFGDVGFDQLWGQAGTDTFSFEHATAFSTRDFIKDFTSGETIDISNILDNINGYVDGTSVLAEYVSVTTDAYHSYVSVDRDGTDTVYGMTQIALVENYNSLSTSDLVTSTV